jgi:hypothetical protein
MVNETGNHAESNAEVAAKLTENLKFLDRSYDGAMVDHWDPATIEKNPLTRGRDIVEYSSISTLGKRDGPTCIGFGTLSDGSKVLETYGIVSTQDATGNSRETVVYLNPITDTDRTAMVEIIEIKTKELKQEEEERKKPGALPTMARAVEQEGYKPESFESAARKLAASFVALEQAGCADMVFFLQKTLRSSNDGLGEIVGEAVWETTWDLKNPDSVHGPTLKEWSGGDGENFRNIPTRDRYLAERKMETLADSLEPLMEKLQ